MKKNKKKQSLLIIALVAVVGIMSIAFALNATTTLTATGTVDVPYANWDVEFSNDEGNPVFFATVDGEDDDTYVTNVALGENGTNGDNTAVTYNVNFGEEDFGKTVEIIFMLSNLGTYDASVEASTPDVDGLTVESSIVGDDFVSPVEDGLVEAGTEAYLLVKITVPEIEEPVEGNKQFGSEEAITLTTTITANAVNE